MEDHRFDHVIRAFGNATTRRTALGAFAAGAATLVAGVSLPGAEAAKKSKKNPKKCKSTQKLCKKKCIKKSSCCTNNDCGGGQTCTKGICACPAGQKPCNSSCIPVANVCSLVSTPGAQQGWQHVVDSDRAGGTVRYVDGPGDPPSGDGSLAMLTGPVPSGASSDRINWVNASYDGTALTDLTDLVYTWYKKPGGLDTVTAAIKIPITYQADVQRTAILVYEPVYDANGANPLPVNSWQVSDALSLEARWWTSGSNLYDANGNIVLCNPNSAGCVGGPAYPYVPWADILGLLADADPEATDIRLGVGSGTPDIRTYVDSIRINGTRFNFEP